MSAARTHDRFLRVARTVRFYASDPEKRAQEIGTALGQRTGIFWLTYNPLVFRYYDHIAEMNAAAIMSAFAEAFPDARAFVDVGAGSCRYAAEARGRGWRVAACERARAGRAMGRRRGVDVRPFHLARDPPSDLVGTFDVAYCIEVAEHVPPPLADSLVRYLCRLAPTVVLTAARPGQGGIGHVNEQPREYWIERFLAHGMAYDAAITRRLHAGFLAHGAATWLADNLSVFRRVAEAGS